MKVVITGAGGLVGGALARRFARRRQVIAPTRADLDVTDGAEVRRLLLREAPQLVVNCAVLGVDESERDPEAARRVNAEAPASLARACAEAGAAFLHFSTNYVFGGGRGPYTAADEPRPVNVYGRSKLEGERAALAATRRCYVVRTSWVFGAGKNNFLGTAHRELLAGRRVRAIVDTRANVTYVEDLAARVEEILARRRFGIYHVVNEGVCTYFDFVLEAARLVGLGEAEAARLIGRVSEGEMRRAAARPRHTPLRCTLSERLRLAPMRGWRAALSAYVAADRGPEKAEGGRQTAEGRRQ